MSYKQQFNNATKWASSIIFIILLTPQCLAQFFEDIPNSDSINQKSDGAVTAWGDFDGDGDVDLALSSLSNNFVELYHNENGVLTFEFTNILGTNGGTMDWADYDGDGDLDLIVSRSSQIGVDDFYLKLYQNNAGTFTLVNGDPNLGLPTRLSHAAAWGDYDQDGDPDLAVIMEDDLDKIRTMIYTNTDGMFTKLDVTLPVAEEGSLSWADYDQDNDLDLLVTGFDRTAFQCKSSIYKNEGGTFTDINAGLQGVYAGSADWGDYDQDGDLDITISGSTRTDEHNQWPVMDPVSYIYQNDGAGGFTNIGATLDGLMYSSSDWGDYDQDGDLDLLITGIHDWEQQLGTSKIYRNNAGVFEDALITLPGVSYGEASWVDYDMDLDLDILLAGQGELTSIRKLYKNGEDQLFVQDVTSSDLLMDLGQSTVAVGDLDGDGDEDIVVSGLDELGQDTVIIYKNNSGELEGMISGVPGKNGGSLDLGDYDQDGDLDLLVTGMTSNGPITDIFQNTNGMFSATNSGLPIVGQNGDSYGKWGDYDQDGDLDLIVGGLTAEFTKSTTIYTNTNGSFTLLTSDIIHANSGAVDWGDYDNDGDLDLAITGGEHFVLLAKIYRNDDGIFVDAVDGLEGLNNHKGIEWADYDLDGDLDLLIAGMDKDLVPRTILYQNNEGMFNEVDAGLEGKMFGLTMWGDHDLDGDMDILAIGESDIGESETRIYSNANGVFTEIPNNIPYIFFSDAKWIDIDGDSDLDILTSGHSFEVETGVLTQLWINKTNPNRPPSDIVLSQLTINQSVGENALVGSLSAIDPETEDTHTFLLTENKGDNSLFYLQDQALYINNATDLTSREYMVYISATDNEGKSLEKPFSITLIDDVDPTVSTKNIELNIPADGTLEIAPEDVDNDSYDPGGNPLTLSLDITTFTCADLGENMVFLTATDPAGNKSSTTAKVVIKECLKYEQNITFDDVPVKTFGDPDFQLSASASSGLNVEFSVVSGPVSVSGNTVTINGAGTATIAASQAGDDNFNAAQEQTQTFEVGKANQVVTIESVSDKIFGDSDFQLSVTSSSGQDVVLSVISGPISINDNTVTINGAGTATIAANQAGNEGFNSADEVVLSFEILRANQMIAIETIDDKSTTDEAFEVSAMVNSGLELTYEISGPATIIGATITLEGAAGIVKVTASQKGNENYKVASAETSFEVFEKVLSIGETFRDLKIFPNPTSNVLYIDSREFLNVELLDMKGKLIHNETIRKGKLNLSDLKKGTYLILLKSKDRITQRKIIKTN